MILGIVGMPGSGKTEIASLFKKKSFKILEMGEIVRAMMKKKGLEINNVSLRKFASEIRKKYGKKFVAEETVKKIKKISKSNKNIIIVGIRSPDEIVFFKKNFNKIIIIAVSAPKKIRFERMVSRNRIDDPESIKDFEYRERKEIGYGVEKALKNADYIIANTGTRKDLKIGIEDIIENVRKLKG
jgi:dephospho-CoA kinase